MLKETTPFDGNIIGYSDLLDEEIIPRHEIRQIISRIHPRCVDTSRVELDDADLIHLLDFQQYTAASVLHVIKLVKKTYGHTDPASVLYHLLDSESGGKGLGVLREEEESCEIIANTISNYG